MTLRGIDISQWQPTTPDLTGLSFVFVRATYGTGYDTRYAMHAANVRAAGLVLGAYAFGRNGDGAAQAATLLAAAPDADLYALDLEADGANPSMTAAQAQAFIAAMHAAGKQCGLYHSLSGFPTLGQDWNWVAAWDGIDPGAGWTLHQWTNKAADGRPLDQDIFAGDAQALAALVAGQSPEGGSVPTTQPSPLTPSAEPLLYAGVITSILVSAGLVSTGEATALQPAVAAVIGALPVVFALITRQFVTPNGKVPTTTTPPTTDPVVVPPVVVPPAPKPPVAVSQITVTMPLPAGTKGQVEGTVRRFDAESPYPELDPIVGAHILAFDAKVELQNTQGHSPQGTFYRTAAKAPVLIPMAYVALLDPEPVTTPVEPAADPAAVIDKTTRPELFASAPAAPEPVSLGAFDQSGAAGKFDAGSPQATALGADTPYMIEGTGGILVTFTRQTAWQWWQAYVAAPFDLRLVMPGAMPGSLVLDPDQYALAVSIGKQVLPPPPAVGFPFPLPLNSNLTIGGGTLEAIDNQIAQGNPSYPRWDPRVSFTADGPKIEGR